MSFGEQYVASGVVALLVATVPLFIALFGALALGTASAASRCAGIAVGLARHRRAAPPRGRRQPATSVTCCWCSSRR